MLKPGHIKITEKTAFSLSLVIVIGGVVAWVSTSVAQNTTSIQKLDDLQHTYSDVVRTIDERLSRIEGKLGIKHENGDD